MLCFPFGYCKTEVLDVLQDNYKIRSTFNLKCVSIHENYGLLNLTSSLRLLVSGLFVEILFYSIYFRGKLLKIMSFSQIRWLYGFSRSCGAFG